MPIAPLENQTYVLYFNYVAIILQTIIIIINFIYNNLPSRSSRLYKLLAFSALVNGIFNTMLYSFLPYATQAESLLFFKILILLNGVFSCFLSPVYFIFTVSLTHEQMRFEKVHYLVTLIPMVATILLIISSPFTHFVAYLDENGTYYENYGLIISYLVNVFYIFFAFAHLLRHKDRVSQKQRIIVTAYTIILLISILFQLLVRHILVMQLANSLAIFLMYFSLRNPGELTDRNSGCYNRTAFREVFFTKHLTSKKYSMGIAKISNFDIVKQNLGTSNAWYLLRQTIQDIEKITGWTDFFYLYRDTFVFVHSEKKIVDYILETIKDYVPSPMEIHAEDGEFSASKVTISFKFRLFRISSLANLKIEDLISSMKNPSDKLIDLLEFTTSNKNFSDENIKEINQDSIKEYQETVTIQQSVQKAIKDDSFEVYLQPIFDLKSQKFTGAESLLRLKNSDGTFIPPSRFIHEAELNGTLLTLGDISLRKTCEYINKSKLLDLGIEKVNINLSIIQCMQENIVEHLTSILSEYCIPHTMIRFEITETLMTTDPQRLKQVMDELSQTGIEFALDDYGTGYSNTSRLLEYPFCEIKFDKSFVDSTIKDMKNAIPLKHLMNMVKDTGRIVLVEGVETKEMADLIKDYGGDLIQGYYYSKPLALEDFVKTVTERNLQEN